MGATAFFPENNAGLVSGGPIRLKGAFPEECRERTTWAVKKKEHHQTQYLLENRSHWSSHRCLRTRIKPALPDWSDPRLSNRLPLHSLPPVRTDLYFSQYVKSLAPHLQTVPQISYQNKQTLNLDAGNRGGTEEGIYNLDLHGWKDRTG